MVTRYFLPTRAQGTAPFLSSVRMAVSVRQVLGSLSLKYSGTSIAAIAKEIGIQKSSLYAHFADKEQLFLEVFQRFHDETALKLSAIFLTELPDKEKLHEVFLLFCAGRNASIFRIGL